MIIPKDIVDRILNEADIVEVLTDFMQLIKRGKNYIGLCPFHSEKTPSFNVSPDKQIYKCFGCGKAGSAVNFVMEITGLNYPDALRYLANKFNILIPETKSDEKKESKKDLVLACLDKATEIYSKKLKDKGSSVAQHYLMNRDFGFEVQQNFILGYAPDSWDFIYNELKKQKFTDDIIIESGLAVKNDNGKIYDRYRNRVIFPIKNFVGKIIGFGGRDIGQDKSNAKYINSPQSIVYDKSRVLYGLYDAKGHIRLKDFVILVEGYADLITLHKEGYSNTVASCGTALTIEQLHLIKRYTSNLVLLYDSDDAGQNATQKAIELALPDGFNIKVVILDDGEDPDSYLRSQGKMLFKTKLDKALDFVSYMIYSYNKKNIDSPKEKSKFINQLIELISKIPDKLQHDYYLDEVSEKLKLTSIQKEELLKIYNKLAGVTEKRTPTKSFEQKSLKVIEEKTDKQTLSLLNSIKAEELYIFKAMLEDKKYYDLILNQKRFTSESFITENAKIIFDAITHTEIEENQSPITSIMNNELTDDKTKELISGIALYEMQASEMWVNYSNINLSHNWDLIIKDSIRNIEINHKMSEQQQLKEKILNAESLEDKLDLIKKLNTLNNELLALNESKPK